MVVPTSACAACHGSDPRFRCTSCRSAWYCSQACQRRDWKAHRRFCRAATELATIVRSVTPTQAEQGYYKAKDLVESILLEGDRNLKSEVNRRRARNESSSSTTTTNESNGRNTGRAALIEESRSRVGNEQSTDLQYLCTEGARDASLSSYATISLRIQHMPRLSCYQVKIGVGSDARDSAINVDALESRLEPSVDSTRWILRETSRSAVLLSLHLPGRIVDVELYDEEPTPCFKLSYEPQSADVQRKKSKMSVSALATIRCRSCRASLLDRQTGSSDDAVTQILPLHSGQFHELMDYLICYPGQPAVDVGSNSLLPTASHVALEDDTSIVLQGQEKSSRWTVLAVPGYGEDPCEGSSSTSTHPSLDLLENSAARRGIRPWRDWVGGATLTCASCASILGFATMQEETLTTAARLLKHRIEWSFSDSDQRPHNVMGFIMNEMIRYAETKAIFAFQVTSEGGTDCLLLRLANWDSEGVELLQGPGVESKSLALEWRQVVQVIYQVSTIPLVESDTANSPQWMWTKDWCCPPFERKEQTTGSSPEPPSSLVRLFLSLCEYDALRQELQSASSWYSDDARRAIISSTTGLSASGAGVAAILL